VLRLGTGLGLGLGLSSVGREEGSGRGEEDLGEVNF
jgi:hypothetical protein